MEFQIEVKEILVNNDNVCVFIGESGHDRYKFTITRSNIELSKRVQVGEKLLITADLNMRSRTLQNGNVAHENVLYVVSL